jgi:hypothetical protein
MSNTKDFIKSMLADKILIKALKEIKAFQGKVCDDFKSCAHKACKSSYCSWTIADNALRTYEAALQGTKHLDKEKNSESDPMV